MTPQFSMFKQYTDFFLPQGKMLWFETDGNSLSECLSRAVLGVRDGLTGTVTEITIDALSSDDYKRLEADIVRIYRVQLLQDKEEKKWATEH